jgi:phosphopantetheine--protein transferase-like protein
MQLKEIISQFLQVDANSITANTLINRQALKSSIFLHRMYGKLADAGFVVADYSNINSFGELENILNGASTIQQSINSVIVAPINQSTNQPINNSSIGIDIENIDSLPKTIDFRNEGFYTDNFSEKEIAYCILQPNAYASFAGLFAAKEAIVKANNQYKNSKFNQLVITHNELGKPTFEGVNISISHTNDSAVAVAVLIETNATTILKEVAANTTYSITTLVVAVVALFLALISIIF